jgi:hypothetical protein
LTIKCLFWINKNDPHFEKLSFSDYKSQLNYDKQNFQWTFLMLSIFDFRWFYWTKIQTFLRAKLVILENIFQYPCHSHVKGTGYSWPWVLSSSPSSSSKGTRFEFNSTIIIFSLSDFRQEVFYQPLLLFQSDICILDEFESKSFNAFLKRESYLSFKTLFILNKNRIN